MRHVYAILFFLLGLTFITAGLFCPAVTGWSAWGSGLLGLLLLAYFEEVLKVK